MMECALYGMTDKVLEWKCKKFKRVERIYTKDRKRAWTYKYFNAEEGEEGPIAEYERLNNEIICKDNPDRNKNRTAIITKLEKIEVFDGNSPDDLLIDLGFSLYLENTVECYEYKRDGYKIELSRFIKDENNKKELSSDLFKYYLVKVFLLIEEAQEGEKILNEAFNDLDGKIILMRPPVGWFVES